jgi:hypothetical protein
VAQTKRGMAPEDGSVARTARDRRLP